MSQPTTAQLASHVSNVLRAAGAMIRRARVLSMLTPGVDVSELIGDESFKRLEAQVSVVNAWLREQAQATGAGEAAGVPARDLLLLYPELRPQARPDP